jgi:hypothetical protein
MSGNRNHIAVRLDRQQKSWVGGICICPFNQLRLLGHGLQFSNRQLIITLAELLRLAQHITLRILSRDIVVVLLPYYLLFPTTLNFFAVLQLLEALKNVLELDEVAEVKNAIFEFATRMCVMSGRRCGFEISFY